MAPNPTAGWQSVEIVSAVLTATSTLSTLEIKPAQLTWGQPPRQPAPRTPHIRTMANSTKEPKWWAVYYLQAFCPILGKYDILYNKQEQLHFAAEKTKAEKG